MIAKEGYGLIAIGLVITVLLIIAAVRWDSRWLFSFSVLFGVLSLFTVFFFRNPDRQFVPEPNILIAPADGKVVAVRDILGGEEGFSGVAVQVSIFLSVFDVHVNRIPTDGVIEKVEYIPGEFFAAFEDKASEKNEQTRITMKTPFGQTVVFKQIAGLIARRIVCHLQPGDSVAAGDRFGLIKFGSRTDLIIPPFSKLLVKKGDIVKGGETVIGYLSGQAGPDKTESKSEQANVEL